MGGRGSGSGGGKSSSSLFNKLQKMATPEMPESMKTAQSLYDKYSDEREMFGDDYALRMMSNSDLNKLAQSEDIDRAYSALVQTEGRKPEYVYATRYGDIPKSGVSTNYADNTTENGVSVIKIINSPKDIDSKSIYDATLGFQGIKKNIVGGWYSGLSGSDGEALLQNAKIVKSNI